MLRVYTAQYCYSGRDRFDITVKSGDRDFAPTWDMVMGIKNGTMSKEKYIKRYVELMRQSYNYKRWKWNNLLDRDKVVLVCFCRKDSFCHRYLLAYILVELGAKYEGELDI